MGKKIGIDFHLLSSKYQGSRTYLINIMHELMKIDRDNTYYICIDDKEKVPSLDEHVERDNFPLRKYYFKNPIFRLGINIPFIEYRDRLDIFHSQYISPAFSFAKEIVTIHDILYETHPQFFTKFFIARSKFFIRISARRATKILTDSKYCKSQLINIYKIPEEKIEIINGGANTEKFNTLNKDRAKEYIYKKFKIRSFILNVGRLEPRKNQISLVKAFHYLLRTNKIDEKLVIIGPKDFHFKPIYQYILNNNLESSIFIFNTIGDYELLLFYKAASIFVYPSFAEGFGLPVLEAMACGIPVIASNSSSIPEVVGDSGILVNPHKLENLIDAIKTLLNRSSLRKELSEKAINRSKIFSWKSAALRTLKIYNEL